MYVGIDVGTRACSASIVDEQGGIKKCLEFANDESGWHVLLAELSAEDHVVLEASTAAYPVHDFFLRQGFRVVMANPSKIRAITDSRSKTDEKDSLILAQLLRLDYIPRSYVPSPEIMRNRELLRTCIDVGQEICRTKNRIHALLTKSGLRPEYKNARDLFRTEHLPRRLTLYPWGASR